MSTQKILEESKSPSISAVGGPLLLQVNYVNPPCPSMSPEPKLKIRIETFKQIDTA